MTKRFRTGILATLFALAAACTAAGCSIGTADLAELTADYKGAVVTYYSNGGAFDSNASITVRLLYYKQEEAPFLYVPDSNMTSSSTSTENTYPIEVSQYGYNLMGWYKADTYTEDGELYKSGDVKCTYTYTDEATNESVTVDVYKLRNDYGEEIVDTTNDRPMYFMAGDRQDILGGKKEGISESDVRAVATDELMTSETIVKSGESFAVCAVWAPAAKLVYELVADEGETYTDAKGNTYTNGDVLYSMAFNSRTSLEAGQTDLAGIETVNGVRYCTLVGTYADKDCTTLAGTIMRPEDTSGRVTVYCKYLAGEWTIVNTVDNVYKMLNSGLGDGKYYITKDVDCSSMESLTPKGIRRECNAVIYGNGHTLSNISISKTGQTSDFAALFGKIASSAVIKDLTISGLTVSVSCKNNSVVGAAICSDINSGAVVENVVFDKVTMELTIPDVDKGLNDEERWLFRSDAADSDEAFLKLHGGITVNDNCSFKVTVV